MSLLQKLYALKIVFVLVYILIYVKYEDYKWIHLGLDTIKPVFRANNKSADQPAHPHSLIRAFVIRFLERIISRLATSKISIFYLVSVAKQASLNLTVRNPRSRFCHIEAHFMILLAIRTV